MRNNECRLLLAGLPLVVFSVAAYGAEPYRFELRGGYSSISSDSFSQSSSVLGSNRSIGDGSDHRLEFSGEYFLRPVETAGGPLQEAAFLSRGPALSFSIAEARADSEARSTGLLGDFASTTESSTREYGLRYRFVAPRKPWISIVGYGYADDESTQLGDELHEKTTSYSLGFGRYVGARTSIVAEYGQSRADFTPLLGTSPDLRSESLSIGVHSALTLGTQRFLGWTAALHQSTVGNSDDSIGSYELGVTYYPRDDISIGLSAFSDYDTPAWWGDRDRHEYSLEASWFVKPSIAVELAYETTDTRLGFVDSFGYSNEAEDESRGFRFGFSWRR